MLKRISIVGAIVILGGVALIGSWFYSERSYARRVRPDGISDLRGFLARHSEVDRAFKIQRGENQYFVATLRVSSGMALPSGPPAYVFDATGRLVDWSADTGEDPRYLTAWPPDQMHQIDLGELKRIVRRDGAANAASPLP